MYIFFQIWDPRTERVNNTIRWFHLQDNIRNAWCGNLINRIDFIGDLPANQFTISPPSFSNDLVSSQRQYHPLLPISTEQTDIASFHFRRSRRFRNFVYLHLQSEFNKRGEGRAKERLRSINGPNLRRNEIPFRS